MLKYEITKTFSGITIVDFLEKFHISKKMIYLLGINKDVFINGANEAFEYVLKENDVLEIDEEKYEKNDMDTWKQMLDIVYEDDDLLIVNKPCNMLIHPDGIDNKTLSNIVKFHYEKNNLTCSVRYIHRLDYQTSGIVVFAKNFLAHSFLSWQLENQMVEKKYLALVENFAYKEVKIDTKIAKDRHENNKYRVSKTSGKEAVTTVRHLKNLGTKKILEANILTGRTHQIRVHLASIKSPIIGDKIYGGTDAPDMCLHHHKISLTHPRTFERIEFVCKKEFKV